MGDDLKRRPRYIIRYMQDYKELQKKTGRVYNIKAYKNEEISHWILNGCYIS
jgi:hypothetical protein